MVLMCVWILHKKTWVIICWHLLCIQVHTCMLIFVQTVILVEQLSYAGTRMYIHLYVCQCVCLYEFVLQHVLSEIKIIICFGNFLCIYTLKIHVKLFILSTKKKHSMAIKKKRFNFSYCMMMFLTFWAFAHSELWIHIKSYRLLPSKTEKNKEYCIKIVLFYSQFFFVCCFVFSFFLLFALYVFEIMRNDTAHIKSTEIIS